MNLDEKFFKYIDKFILNLFYRNSLKKKCKNDSVVYLSTLKLRFSSLATILYGKRLKISESSVLTGISNNTLFLPEFIFITDVFELNVLAYIYRIVFSVTQAFLKFSFKNYNRIDFNVLCMLLTINKTHEFIFTKYPKISYFKHLLYSIVLRNRKQNLSKLSGSSLFFEICIREFLIINSYEESKYLVKNVSVVSILLYDIITVITKNNIDLHEKVYFFSKKINALFNDNLNIEPDYIVLWGTFVYLENINTFGSLILTNLPVVSLQITPKTVRKRKKTDTVVTKLIESKKNKHGDLPILTLFQNVKTIEQYEGGVRDYDSSDELNEHYDALEDINVNKILRDSKNTESVFYVNSVLKGDFLDLDDVTNIINNDFFYNEWVFLKKEYKKNWCRVTEYKIPKKQINISETEYIIKKNKHVIQILQKYLKAIFNKEQWKRRELDGTEIDLDSFIDNFAALYTNNFIDEKLYKRRFVLNKEIVCSILVDASLSTDSWFGDSSVLQFAKEITIILGQIFNACDISFSISFFYSNTHVNCSILDVKDFKTSWNISKNHVPTILSQGYTRIGPALRHTMFKLSKIKAKTKTIILLSDSKPTDYDYYEGDYGVEDVRQVLRESVLQNVRIKSISLLEHPESYLNRMYGFNNYYCVGNKNELLQRLFKVVLCCCGKIKK